MTFPEIEDPLSLFDQWLEQARARSDIRYAHAFTLSTVDEDGLPDARVVLAHRVDSRGLLFSTDEESAKARQLRRIPFAAATFSWQPLDRQVRLSCRVEAGSDEDSDFCFEERPRDSRITAWVSRQGRPLKQADLLLQAWNRGAERFEGVDPIPRPETWRAYLLIPHRIELWQAAAKRLHHRLLFERRDDTWMQNRLWP